MIGQFMAQLKRLYEYVAPPPQWRVPILVLGGIFAGLGLHILHISNAFSYLSDKPEVCMNCHVMTTQYATWARGDHGHRANCNDCHVPQDNVFKKYLFKAMDGLRHSTIFTLRMEPQVIRIKEMGSAAVQDNCQRCHARVMLDVRWDKNDRCWRCHRTTPHGDVNSLASAPFARVPRLVNPVPPWLDALMAKERDAQRTKEISR